MGAPVRRCELAFMLSFVMFGIPSTGQAEPAPCAGKLVVATWYETGTETASGERFDPDGLTAAHRTLPFGSRVTVTNPRNGKSVTITINDRGPFTRGIDIDLSRGAARAIDMASKQPVCMSEISR
jgi:rare lipoprotein A